jgi:D-alanyl-D-alanine-carboxypeptidase/D-alanyl-D-alanine-endopeptidase
MTTGRLLYAFAAASALACSSPAPAAGSGGARASSTGAGQGGADTGADASNESAAVEKAIDGMVQPVMAEVGAVGMVVGVIDGPTRVIATYGETVHGNAVKPTPTTLFEIGSNTKCFTATLLANAVATGKLMLEDTLTSHLPASYAFAPGSEKAGITLLELADHTSGFPRNPNDVNGAITYSVTRVYQDADTILLATAPGAKFGYSNLGFALLGDALANASGQTWDALVASVLTVPLAMPDTALAPVQPSRAAQGYDSGCGTPPCPTSQTLILATFPAPGVDPAGGLWSSGADMMTWLAYNMQLEGPPDLLALVPTLRQPRVMALPNQQVGLAWNTSSLTVRGQSVSEVWKDGDTNGFHSYVAYVPSRQIGVFVLANFFSGTVPRTIGDQILAALP